MEKHTGGKVGRTQSKLMDLLGRLNRVYFLDGFQVLCINLFTGGKYKTKNIVYRQSHGVGGLGALTLIGLSVLYLIVSRTGFTSRYIFIPLIVLLLIFAYSCIVRYSNDRIVSISDLSSEKLNSLNEKVFPKAERQEMLQQWLALKAKAFVPKAAKEVVSIERQLEANKKIEIKFDIVNKLFEQIGIEFRFILPLSQVEFESLGGDDGFNEMAKMAYSKLVDSLMGCNASNTRKICSEIYDDLACYFHCQYDENFDVALVPGARTILRAKTAVDLFNSKFVKTLFVTGNRPTYQLQDEISDGEEYRYLTESQALRIYMVDERGVDPKNIIMDKSATDTPQNISTLLRYLADNWSPEISGYSVLIVTSPYHVKRCVLYARLAMLDPKTKIQKVCSYASQTKYGKDNWYLKEEGFLQYIAEYWKIHNTRALGDF